MIKGTAKAISDYELEKEYRLSLQQPRVKGASYVDPTARIERQVKLEMLGKMIKESKKDCYSPELLPKGCFFGLLLFFLWISLELSHLGLHQCR
jgi:hypothetical protein